MILQDYFQGRLPDMLPVVDMEEALLTMLVRNVVLDWRLKRPRNTKIYVTGLWCTVVRENHGYSNTREVA